MPQPLSRVRLNASFQLGDAGDSAFSHNPSLGLLAMEGIATWSNVENFLLSLYLELLGGSSDLAAIAYLAIETQSAKTQVIRAVSQSALSQENFSLLAAILAISKTAQKSRDKLAHHIWGFSHDLPDKLLLVDPKSFARRESERNLKDYIMVYDRSDFQEIIRLNDRICGWGLLFKWVISGHIANKTGKIYARLCAEPEIQERLNRPA